MTLNAVFTVIGLLAVLFLISAGRNMRRRRMGAGFFRLLMALLLILLVGSALWLSINLRTYRRISAEQSAGELRFTRIGYHQFNGVFTYPSGETADFELRGDEWQVDAQVLKWHALANLAGFDAAYRLDRISGRYTNIDDEKKLPRTVYAMNPPEHFDLWTTTHRFQHWIPWIDALYGSATFLPMEDGAVYAVSVSETGLLARPVNQSAHAAVSDWH